MTLSSIASRICVTTGVYFLVAAMAPVALAATTERQATTPIEQQRALFRSVFESVERGDWSAVDDLSALARSTESSNY